MEKHCVSLELAKELKEAGWKKETEFWWEEWIKNAHTPYKSYLVREKRNIPYLEGRMEYISAPLATEILEDLPAYITQGKWEHILKILKIEKENYSVNYTNNECRSLGDCFCRQMFVDKPLPNVLAKMWLYLKKNNLLTHST